VKYDASNATCRVYTFKEGVLAAVGHDLVLAVDRFTLELEPEGVRATFDLASIRTICARKNRADAPGVLSADDCRQIEENTRTQVLEVSRFPTATFTSTKLDRDDPEEWEVAGQLALHGVTRAVRAQVRQVAGRRVARLALNQPDWGIKPFSALLGTLRVKPGIEVEVSIPDAG
jgi:polyisoprenoid-binding protein YceI